MNQNLLTGSNPQPVMSDKDQVVLESEISRRLNLFNEIGRVVLSALDQEEIPKVAVDAIHFALGLKHVALFQIDYQFNDVVLKAQAGEFVGVIPNHLRRNLNDAVLGRSARTGEIQVVIVSRENLHETLVGQPVKEIYLPVKIAGQTFAILYAACEITANAKNFEIAALETIAGQLGIAIENARLFTEINQTQRDLGLLLASSKDLSSSLELNSIIDRFAYRLMEIIPDSRLAIIQCQDHDNDK